MIARGVLEGLVRAHFRPSTVNIAEYAIHIKSVGSWNPESGPGLCPNCAMERLTTQATFFLTGHQAHARCLKCPTCEHITVRVEKVH